jgi:hypothetical protein
MKLDRMGVVAGLVVASGACAAGQSLTVDDTNVYWTDGFTTGSVVKVPIAGGAPVTLATDMGYPLGIAVDATSVYWVNITAGAIMKVAK